MARFQISRILDFGPIRHGLMDLKSAHSQESDFQESAEADRFLKMGTHFQERSGSGKWSLCYMVRLLAMPRVFVAFDTCCSGANL